MDKQSITYDLTYIKYKTNISCLAQIDDNIFASGDNTGKIYLWDIKTEKASCYINTSLQEKITQISIDNNKLYFSQGKKIKSVDLNVIKHIYNEKDIYTEFTFLTKVDDFSISSKFIITNDQDNDTYVIVKRLNENNSEIETQSISNVFGQVILPESKPKVQIKKNKKKDDEDFDSLFDSLSISIPPKDKETPNTISANEEGLNKCIFITFDGRLIKYDLDNNKFLNEKNVNNFINKEVYNEYLTNPPYVSCYHLNKDLLSIGLMNGIIITFRHLSLKKESLRTLHSSAVIKIASFSNDLNLNISIDRDNKIKVHKDFEQIIFTLDLSLVYNTKFVPIDFASLGNIIILSDNLKDSIKLINIKIN